MSRHAWISPNGKRANAHIPGAWLDDNHGLQDLVALHAGLWIVATAGWSTDGRHATKYQARSMIPH